MGETRMLPVILLEGEVLDRAADLAKKIQEHGFLVDRRKEEAKSQKEEIDGLSDEISDLARVVREKKEDRPVEVIERFDVAARLVLEVRTDTNEQISSRPMSLSELQEHEQRALPFGRETAAEKADEKKKAASS